MAKIRVRRRAPKSRALGVYSADLFPLPTPRPAREVEHTYTPAGRLFGIHGDPAKGGAWLVYAEQPGTTLPLDFGPFECMIDALNFMKRTAPDYPDHDDWYTVQDTPQGWDECIRARWV